MRRWTAVGTALVLAAGSGCTAFTPGDPCGSPPAASSAFPSSTVEDWVTYGDHAVVLRGADELDQDGREVVRLRHERTLWSRAQAPAPAPVETSASTRRSHDAAAA